MVWKLCTSLLKWIHHCDCEKKMIDKIYKYVSDFRALHIEYETALVWSVIFFMYERKANFFKFRYQRGELVFIEVCWCYKFAVSDDIICLKCSSIIKWLHKSALMFRIYSLFWYLRNPFLSFKMTMFNYQLLIGYLNFGVINSKRSFV